MKALAYPAIPLAAASCFMAWAVRGRASSVFAPSVWRGPGERRVLALTFDDGPSEGTPEILEILARYRAPATFFQCGANVERLPAVARAVAQAGHEIGNHSHTHPMFCLRTPSAIEEDLRNQYSIGYSPDATAAAGYRRIHLRTKQKGLTVQTREGYYPA